MQDTSMASVAASRSPCTMYKAADITRAKKNIARYAWARDVYAASSHRLKSTSAWTATACAASSLIRHRWSRSNAPTAAAARGTPTP